MGGYLNRAPSTDTSRHEADQTLRELGKLRAASEHELCQWLLCGFRLRVHDIHAYGSFREYALRVFGFTGRATEERVRTALKLESLPKLDAAFAAGELVFSVVRELTRVADAETEEEWLEAAAGKTAYQVERMTSGRTVGDRPSDPARPEVERKRVTLELSASSYALLKQARDVARDQSGGGHLDDDAFVRLLAGTLLAGGETDGSRSPHQIALTVCEACRAATQDAGGERTPVEEAAVEMAECDAQLIGRVDGSGDYDRASQKVPPAVRRAVIRRHGRVCAVPGCRHTICHVHHVDPQAEGGDHDPERLIMLCSAHHGYVHEGTLVIRGTWSEGFTFTHADGTSYGAPHVGARVSTTLTRVFQLLKARGFGESESRQLVERASPHVGADTTEDEALEIALRHVKGAGGTRESRARYQRLDPHVGAAA